MVFQNYALYPHMTVYENMAFGLKLRKVPKWTSTDACARRRASSASRIPRAQAQALSGGQRQRVAMGRAIVREPAAFLMDEPLSNLDAKLRVTCERRLAAPAELNITTLYVTHDQVEAMTMGDRVAVMRRASSSRSTRPKSLRSPDEPVRRRVHGSPSMNLVGATLPARPTGHLMAEFGSVQDRSPGQHPRHAPGPQGVTKGKEVVAQNQPRGHGGRLPRSRGAPRFDRIHSEVDPPRGARRGRPRPFH